MSGGLGLSQKFKFVGDVERQTFRKFMGAPGRPMSHHVKGKERGFRNLYLSALPTKKKYLNRKYASRLIPLKQTLHFKIIKFLFQ